MHIINFKSTISVKDTLKGLWFHFWEAVMMILLFTFILGMIFAPLIIYMNYKLSDKQFCPRLSIQDPKIRLQRYGCPPIKIIVYEKN